jgi:hypothetical protein
MGVMERISEATTRIEQGMRANRVENKVGRGDPYEDRTRRMIGRAEREGIAALKAILGP